MARGGGGGRSGGGGGSRGGGGGGSRSFGSGGGRSFGGRSGGGSFNRGGVSGGSGGFSSRPGGSRPPAGGGYRPPPPRPPMYPRYHRPRRTFVFFGPRRHYGYGGGGGGMGCLTLPALLGILVIVTILFFFIPMGSGYSYSYGYGSYETQVTKSTVQREALPPGSVVETPYFTDELGWIRNQSKLTPGMKNFYSRTGIQPYLYLTESINGSTSPTAADVEEFADRLYDELFNDEAHFLVIFQEYNDQYTLWYLGGSQTLTVMDAEASDILMDYIDKYYYSQTMTDEEFFSKAFDEASKRIMTVTRSPWISVAVIGGVILLAVIGFFWWSKAKKQKNLEAQQTKDILNTPLETFGGSEAEDLGKKYDDNNT